MHAILALLVSVFAGLGLIFIGSRLLTDGMKRICGPRIRRLTAFAGHSPARGAAIGVVAGTLLQSTNAVSFIAGGLVAAGSLALPAALPLVAWCYTGTTLRLMLMSFDIHMVALLLVGLAGLAFNAGWDRKPARADCVMALTGLALLLLGTETIASGAAAMRASPELADFVIAAAAKPGVILLLGAALGALMQAMPVTLLAMALAAGGLLSLDAAMLLAAGANVGLGIFIWVQGSAMRGMARRLSIYQMICKGLGAAVMIPALLAEQAGVLGFGPGALARLAGADAATALTALHLQAQVVPAILLLPLNRHLLPSLASLAPEAEGSVAAVYPQAASTPA